MIRRRFWNGPIDVECDACPDGIETPASDLSEAIAIIKQEGWRVTRDGGVWVHTCPACEPGDRRV